MSVKVNSDVGVAQHGSVERRARGAGERTQPIFTPTGYVKALDEDSEDVGTREERQRDGSDVGVDEAGVRTSRMVTNVALRMRTW